MGRCARLVFRFAGDLSKGLPMGETSGRENKSMSIYKKRYRYVYTPYRSFLGLESGRCPSNKDSNIHEMLAETEPGTTPVEIQGGEVCSKDSTLGFTVCYLRLSRLRSEARTRSGVCPN